MSEKHTTSLNISQICTAEILRIVVQGTIYMYPPSTTTDNKASHSSTTTRQHKTCCQKLYSPPTDVRLATHPSLLSFPNLLRTQQSSLQTKQRPFRTKQQPFAIRLSCVILFAAATATLLTTGQASAEDFVRKTDISPVTSPDAVVAVGTSAVKRFLRYHSNELRGDDIEDEDEDEDEDRGLFDASKLKALAREADGLHYTELKGTGVKRFFKTLTSNNYNPVNVPIPHDYQTLRTLYHSWYYSHYIPKIQG
ncbi:unnamed protein product [Phytophthora fragariaefolia]|uniref:RxLR effector protein n=1 Tax=Phytophthora fragariaefolia TaxID=1490495 RepID=A0A9W6YEY5_9STRA|nr:unnamed protein product [Phytophthora fragariaefolia]